MAKICTPMSLFSSYRKAHKQKAFEPKINKLKSLDIKSRLFCSALFCLFRFPLSFKASGLPRLRCFVAATLIWVSNFQHIILSLELFVSQLVIEIQDKLSKHAKRNPSETSVIWVKATPGFIWCFPQISRLSCEIIMNESFKFS